jgi:hypothetical protein
MAAVFFAALVGVGFSDCPTVDTANTTVSVSDTEFVDCVSPVRLGRCHTDATIMACTFYRCESESDGGGIWFQGTELEIHQCEFTECLAWNNGSAIYANGCPTSNLGEWIFNDNLVRLGTCASHAISLSAARQFDGTSVALERTNLTSNTAFDGTALIIQMARGVAVDFCLFESNYGLSCVVLERRLGSVPLRCLGFRSNICTTGRGWDRAAFFVLYASWTIKDSVLANNSYYGLIQPYSSGSWNYDLICENCYFDEFPRSTGYLAKLSLRSCEAGVEVLPPWGQCPNRTLRKTKTDRPTWSPQRTRTSSAIYASTSIPDIPVSTESSHADTIWLAIWVPIGILILASVLYILIQQRKNSPAAPKASLESSASGSKAVGTDEGAVEWNWKQRGESAVASGLKSPLI